MEILVIWHLGRAVFRPGVLLFYQKEVSSVKQVDIRSIFNSASKSVCTSTFVISLEPLSSTPTTAENTEEDPNNPEGDNQMQYSSDSCTAPSIAVATQNYLYELMSVQVSSDNPLHSVIWQLSGPMQIGVTSFCPTLGLLICKHWTGSDRRDTNPQRIAVSHVASSVTGSFEESVLNGRLEPVSTVQGFTADLGASGSFCPRHLVLPVTVFFYTLGDNDKVSTPYLVSLL